MEPILLDLKHLGESKEVYEHEGEEFIYILQGKIDLIDLSNDKTYTRSKGETFYAKGDFRHKLINRYIHNAKVLWICTPPIF